MISKRLTKPQKDEILEAYRAGENTNTLAEKFSCSSNTVNRAVKTLLTDSEYKSLKEQRLRNSNTKDALINDKICCSPTDNNRAGMFFLSYKPTIFNISS